MFGTVRTTLALMVMVHHLFYPVVLGPYAVFGFYILSGYLMTLIMHESYGYHREGRINFAVNRVLRLFPMYWVAALFSVLLIAVIGGETVRDFHRSMFIPTDARSIAQNVLMIFPAWHPDTVDPRLVPTTWALTVEMFFYATICAGLSKTLARVVVWLLLSLAYVPLSYYLGGSMSDRYFPIPAASLPFAIGGLLYFGSRSPAARAAFARLRWSTDALFAAVIGNALLWIVVHLFKVGRVAELGFYLNVAICAALFFSIITGGRVSGVGPRADKFIGDLSYPIYLLQWQVGLLVSVLLFGAPMHEEFSLAGLANLLASIAVAIGLSVALIYLVDHPVQALRERIKARNPPSPAEAPVRTTLPG